MSFVTNPVQQMTIDDITFHLTARERKALEQSWAKSFSEEIFPKIDEEPFRVLYCQDNGSPNTPVKILIGACIISLADADTLFALCKDRYVHWEEYRLFRRCMAEQTIVDEGLRRLATSEEGTMNSTMLQNPADPEATFRSKAGKEHRGYVANLEESVGENGSVITDYQFEQNTYSDSQFLHDSLEKMEVQEESIILVTDGAYPTPDNQKLAESKNVEIVSTNMTGRKAKDICADFVMNKEKTAILQCPAGIDAISCSGPYKNGQMRATFPAACCNNCPNKDKCPAKIGKRVSAVILSASSISRAQNQRHTQGEEGRNFAKFRNGVETIPSLLRRKYHAENLPRGKTRGSLFFGFKIGALNFKKLFTYQTASGRYAQNPVIA